MKRSFSIFLMLLSLLIGFRQGIIILHFKLNQAAIEERFCENKKTPAINCHGECHLRKQLQKADSTDVAFLHVFLRGDMLPTACIEFDVANSIVELPIQEIPHQEVGYHAPSLEIFVPPPLVG